MTRRATSGRPYRSQQHTRHQIRRRVEVRAAPPRHRRRRARAVEQPPPPPFFSSFPPAAAATAAAAPTAAAAAAAATATTDIPVPRVYPPAPPAAPHHPGTRRRRPGRGDIGVEVTRQHRGEPPLVFAAHLQRTRGLERGSHGRLGRQRRQRVPRGRGLHSSTSQLNRRRF